MLKQKLTYPSELECPKCGVFVGQACGKKVIDGKMQEWFHGDRVRLALDRMRSD